MSSPTPKQKAGGIVNVEEDAEKQERAGDKDVTKEVYYYWRISV